MYILYVLNVMKFLKSCYESFSLRHFNDFHR